MGSLVQVGLGVDHVGVGVRAVGDPGLAAVEHEAIALAVGAQLHRHHVGASIGLAHGQRADVFTGDQLGQVFRLLLRRAVAVYLIDAQVRMRAVGQPHRGRAAADFFERDDVGQVAHAGAAVFLVYGDTEQAHVAELAPHVAGKEVVAVDGFGAGRQFVGHETAHLVAEHVDGFTEGEVEAGVVHVPPVRFCRCSGSTAGRRETLNRRVLQPVRYSVPTATSGEGCGGLSRCNLYVNVIPARSNCQHIGRPRTARPHNKHKTEDLRHESSELHLRTADQTPVGDDHRCGVRPGGRAVRRA